MKKVKIFVVNTETGVDKNEPVVVVDCGHLELVPEGRGVGGLGAGGHRLGGELGVTQLGAG